MGLGRLSLSNPHVTLPHFHRVEKCDACGAEKVCREGAFSEELHRRVWLCYRPGVDCCWQKREQGGNGAQP